MFSSCCVTYDYAHKKFHHFQYATTPFKGTSRNKTFQNILTGSVWFPEAIILPSSPKAQSMPPKLSSSCKSFIKSLLNKDPRGRLGYQAGAGDVRAHKWFRDINFALVRNTKPPLQPECCEIFDGSPGRSLEWCKETTRKQSNPSVDSTDPFDQFCSGKSPTIDISCNGMLSPG
jgi:hypothetical protein